MSTVATPEATVLSFLGAFSRLDLDRMLTYFAPDATLFFPSEPRRLVGLEAIRQAFDGTIVRVRAAGGSSLTLHPEDEAMQLLGEVAIVTFHLPPPIYGRRTFVLRRHRDTWQIVHLHGSNLVPARTS